VIHRPVLPHMRRCCLETIVVPEKWLWIPAERREKGRKKSPGSQGVSGCVKGNRLLNHNEPIFFFGRPLSLGKKWAEGNVMRNRPPEQRNEVLRSLMSACMRLSGMLRFPGLTAVSLFLGQRLNLFLLVLKSFSHRFRLLHCSLHITTSHSTSFCVGPAPCRSAR